MIARLTGVLAESSYTQCIIDVHGVGYEVAIPLSTFDKLPQPGNEVKLHIHTQVREDAISLFGFATTDEKALFKKLIDVSGIGGKLALSVLSAMPVSTFVSAVVNGDVKALSRINGIGKRTAERMIVELKDKLSALGMGDAAPAAVKASAAVNDACLALEQLGFKRDAIDKTIQALLTELPEEEHTVDNLLRKAIIRLNF
ncbi:MAG: Holliday junction branch migration protein RuvA [Lentisphaeria bacterium]|nr:Holliday junction branch migration protein RuvA [Lentisphaeria bacterium]